MSDDTDSNVINLPTRGSDSGGMPDAPDAGDLFYSEPSGSSADDGAPPDSPEMATGELPAIRGPISPEVALRETGMPDAPDSEEEEYEEGEYKQPRSLADRLGDWLELRLEVARDRHAGEAPFREAEIARKAALLEARTAQETAMMEQNAKLHTAQMKAKSDKAAARGKADAARSSGSGLGADKGGRSKAGGGGGSRGGGGSSGGSGRGKSPKGAGKGSDRSAGGGKGPNQSSGGPKGRQNGSGGSGSGKAGTGKGSSGGSGGKNGSGSTGTGKGGSKGDGGKSKDSPAASPRAERARGRQERAAARQAARQQRRGANQAANLADRSKDRDQDRAAVQAAREERRRAKAERKAAARAKREAAKAADDRTTLGAAVGQEAQRRWDKRRAAEKDKAAKDGKARDDAKDATGDKDSETTKKMTRDDPEKPSDGPKDDSATKEPEDGKKSGEKPSDASTDTDAKDGTGTDTDPKADDVKDPPDADDSDDERSFREWFKDFFTKAGEDNAPPEPEESSRLRPEDLGDVTVERPGGPTRSPQPEPTEDDIPDAVIVDDPSDPFGAHVSSPASLPRAPEPHTQRPGTSRPTAQEDPVASEVNKPASGQARMAAKHRTDITFGEYLMEIVNIAIAAALDKDRAQDLAVALGKVADALRDMAADLVGDHNIATEVVNQITDLADAAERMKQLAERCATECEIASEAARLAAMSVGRVYGQDVQAMDDAGLANASSAAHHD
ncbi:ATP/GTP-binding protein [Streptomyces beigongshangae]|uniref:ATP/GTP-binding protein n=1 Tax=Streptomyces beigongshangae TaxID=2841597 RepID=UPI0027E06E45|nr:ATP/GTP-binding protein [Streptomyces sp. REN17]